MASLFDQKRISVEGTISETSTVFNVKFEQDQPAFIDLGGVTIINSVGVKNWINWISRANGKSVIHFFNCPFVIVNQASTVHGFMPRFAFIESFRAPYVCPKCTKETIVTLNRPTDYDYATDSSPKKINLPTSYVCEKCKLEMEPDFTEEKHLAFLKLK